MESILQSVSVEDLDPIIESLLNSNELLSSIIKELVQVRIYSLWILGIVISISALCFAIVFSIFFSKFSK